MEESNGWTSATDVNMEEMPATTKHTPAVNHFSTAATQDHPESDGQSDIRASAMEEGQCCANASLSYCAPQVTPYVPIIRKVMAEMISTFILIFTGCGAVMVDARTHGAVTHVGVSISFGLVVMIMIYAVGHISGAHMNPAVTLAFATVRHFPWKQVPLYIAAQCTASVTASFALKTIFNNVAKIGATTPAGSAGQSLVLEIILTFILMFVVSAVATDTRAVGELAGIAVGATVALDALMGGPVSGASMNPARSLGPAVAGGNYKDIWVYFVGPVVGALAGAWSYNLIRGDDRPPGQSVRRSKSFSASHK